MFLYSNLQGLPIRNLNIHHLTRFGWDFLFSPKIDFLQKTGFNNKKRIVVCKIRFFCKNRFRTMHGLTLWIIIYCTLTKIKDGFSEKFHRKLLFILSYSVLNILYGRFVTSHRISWEWNTQIKNRKQSLNGYAFVEMTCTSDNSGYRDKQINEQRKYDQKQI